MVLSSSLQFMFTFEFYLLFLAFSFCLLGYQRFLRVNALSSKHCFCHVYHFVEVPFDLKVHLFFLYLTSTAGCACL